MIELRTAWPDEYRRGSHCFSTMLSNIVADSEMDLTEELCYVLGCGLGLMFYSEDERYLINSRMHDLEHFFARHVGGRIDYESHDDLAGMLDRADEWINDGVLPFAYCEARDLPGFEGVLPWRDVHPFGEHALPIRAVREDHIEANDYLWRPPIIVNHEDLDRAASMRSDGNVRMASAAHKYAVGKFVPPRAVPNWRDAILLAVAENSHLLLNPVNNTQGQRALKSLERQLSSMPSVIDAEDARGELISMATTLEKIGTGGGAGRHVYGRGLKQAAEKFEIPELLPFAQAYGKLGGQWRRFSRDLMTHAATPDVFADWQVLVLGARALRNAEVETATEMFAVVDSLLGTSAQ